MLFLGVAVAGAQVKVNLGHKSSGGTIRLERLLEGGNLYWISAFFASSIFLFMCVLIPPSVSLHHGAEQELDSCEVPHRCWELSAGVRERQALSQRSIPPLDFLSKPFP